MDKQGIKALTEEIRQSSKEIAVLKLEIALQQEQMEAFKKAKQIALDTMDDCLNPKP